MDSSPPGPTSAPGDPPPLSPPDAPPPAAPASPFVDPAPVLAGGADSPPPLTPPELLASAASPPPAPPPPPSPSAASFVFHGTAAEYFRIWIVNTLLTLLTLGVFSAWAKVRKRRYLRGNTELLGHRFDYTADPRRILVGNLIVVALFLAYALFGAVYPALRVLALVIGLALLPWIIVRSLSFNAHHTMWRGLRFHFHPSLSAAVMVYLLQPLIIPFTLGLYYPAWSRARAEFRVSRHRLGTAYFRFHVTSGAFYRAQFAAGGIVFVGLLVLGITTQYLRTVNGGHVPTNTQLAPALLVYLVALFVAKHYAFARLFNPLWNGTTLDQQHFHANLRTGRWVGLQLANLVAIVVSCGLLYPWAVVRSTRYALGCLTFEPTAALEKTQRLGAARGSAVGDTAAEFAGLDFGL